MFTRTRSSIPSMLNRLPPYSGIRLSTSVTSAWCSASRRARFEPRKPRPPVIKTFLAASCFIESGLIMGAVLFKNETFAARFHVGQRQAIKAFEIGDEPITAREESSHEFGFTEKPGWITRFVDT